jgi:serine/threonine-protein kinase OSR1/STK39
MSSIHSHITILGVSSSFCTIYTPLASEVKKWTIDGTPLDPSSSELSDLTTTGTRKSFFTTENFGGFTQQDGFKIWKKAEIVRLDLEIGLVRDSKDELDLELRLGSLN